MRIPGISELTEGEENLLPTLFLLEGPLGVGKREYCTKFLEDGINDNAYCIIVSARITDSQFKDLFFKIDQNLLKNKFKFINPLLTGSNYADVSLDSVYKEIFSFLHLDNKKRKQVSKQGEKNEPAPASADTSTFTSTTIIIFVHKCINSFIQITSRLIQNLQTGTRTMSDILVRTDIHYSVEIVRKE